MSIANKQLKDMLKFFKRDFFNVSQEEKFALYLNDLSEKFFTDNFLVAESHSALQKKNRFHLNIQLIRFLDKSTDSLCLLEEKIGKKLLTDILLVTAACYIYSNVKYYLLEQCLPFCQNKIQYFPLTSNLDTELFSKYDEFSFLNWALMNAVGGNDINRTFSAVYENKEFDLLSEENKVLVNDIRKTHATKIMPFDLNAVSIMFKGDWKADKYDSLRSSETLIKDMDVISFVIGEFLPYSQYSLRFPINNLLEVMLPFLYENKDYVNARQCCVVSQLLNTNFTVGNYSWGKDLLETFPVKDQKTALILNNHFCQHFSVLIMEINNLNEYFSLDNLAGDKQEQADFMNNFGDSCLQLSRELLITLSFIHANYSCEMNDNYFNMLLKMTYDFEHSTGDKNNEQSVDTVNYYRKNIDIHFYEKLKKTNLWSKMVQRYDIDHEKEEQIKYVLTVKEEKNILNTSLKQKFINNSLKRI